MAEVSEVNIRRGGNMAEGGGGGGMGRFIKMILALVLLALLGAGGFAAYLFLSTGKEAANKEVAAALRQDGGSIKNPHYLDLGDFIVNLADGRRYLKTHLQLLVSDEKAVAYLQVRLAEVKDLIIAELQTMDSEQLRDGRNRELLKGRLLTKIESLLPSGKEKDWDDPKPIKKVLITEFYLQ
jgi:flagellar protein FliL